jgi:phage gpG-like protein
MTLDITAKIEGDVQLDRSLGLAAKGLNDFSVPLDASADRLLNTADRNFDARGGLMGGWKPRTRAYAHPLLELTGTMRRSFYKKPINNKAIAVGNDDYKFKYHQSNKPRTRLPRRVMLKIIDADKRAIAKEFQTFVADTLKNRRTP